MDSGFYAAFTGLAAQTQALELAANNLADISATGYKAQREFYKSLTASLGKKGNSLYSAPKGTATPAADPQVRQGMLEASNMSPIRKARSTHRMPVSAPAQKRGVAWAPRSSPKL